MSKDIKALSEKLRKTLNELVDIVGDHEDRLSKLEEGWPVITTQRDEKTELGRDWEDADFEESLSLEAKRVLLLFRRSKDALSTRYVSERFNMSLRHAANVITGFGQKKTRSGYDELIKKGDKSGGEQYWEMPQQMKDKYGEKIERLIGDRLQ